MVKIDSAKFIIHDPVMKINSAKCTAFWPVNREKLFRENFCTGKFTLGSLGSMSFCQLIGIPVGFDPAPFMVNQFLYCYERKKLLLTKKTTLKNGTWEWLEYFQIFLGLWDDLCTCNNEEFENNFKDIYPDELKPKKVNEDPCKVSFFEFSIEVNDKRVLTVSWKGAFPLGGVDN